MHPNQYMKWVENCTRRRKTRKWDKHHTMLSLSEYNVFIKKKDPKRRESLNRAIQCYRFRRNKNALLLIGKNKSVNQKNNQRNRDKKQAQKQAQTLVSSDSIVRNIDTLILYIYFILPNVLRRFLSSHCFAKKKKKTKNQ